MTVCIVHRDGWAVTDSRQMRGSTLTKATPKKAFVAGDYLIAGAGVLGTLELIREGVTAVYSYEIPERIREILKKEDAGDNPMDIATVHRDGSIVTYDCIGCPSIIDVDQSFDVLGSARQMVTGYLQHIIDTVGRITPEDACAAVRAASKWDTSIDDRCQIVRLSA